MPLDLVTMPIGEGVRRDPNDERNFALSFIKYPGETVLDVGTGSCACIASILASRGRLVVAMDKFHRTIRAARRFLVTRRLTKLVRLLQDDITGSHLASASFRNIVCFNVLHHVSPLDSALSELCRILAEDGRLIISDFDENGDGFLRRLEEGVHQHFRRSPVYRRPSGRLVLICEK